MLGIEIDGVDACIGSTLREPTGGVAERRPQLDDPLRAGCARNHAEQRAVEEWITAAAMLAQMGKRPRADSGEGIT